MGQPLRNKAGGLDDTPLSKNKQQHHSFKNIVNVGNGFSIQTRKSFYHLYSGNPPQT
ncbi:hypothetical protein [Thermosphaera sp.]